MKCPKCGVEMRVKAAYRVRGDTSPATPTRLVLAQAFFCRSRACENFGRQVCEKEHEVPLERVPAGAAGGLSRAASPDAGAKYGGAARRPGKSAWPRRGTLYAGKTTRFRKRRALPEESRAGAAERRRAGKQRARHACAPLPGTERHEQKGGDRMAKLDIPNTGSMTVKAPKPTASTKKPVVKTGK